MYITWGQTRFVFLVGKVAIKIPRLRGMRILFHVVRFFIGHMNVGEKLRENKYNDLHYGIRLYLKRNVFGGICANRQEYRLYFEHPEKPIAPVYSMFLWGLVLIMERGMPVDPEKSVTFRALHPGCDFDKPEHVCAFGTEQRYIDFGHPDAPQSLGIV